MNIGSETLTVIVRSAESWHLELTYTNARRDCQVVEVKGGQVVFAKASEGTGDLPLHTLDGNTYLHFWRIYSDRLVPKLKKDFPPDLYSALEGAIGH